MEKSAAAERSLPRAISAIPHTVRPLTALRWLGLLVFPILLAFGVDFGDAFRAIRAASPGFVIASLIVIQLSFLARARRWQLFCEAADIRDTSFWSLYSIQYAGLFAGAALPQGAAPFTQVIFLAEAGHSWRRGIISILADRLWEAFFILLFATVAAAYLWSHFPRVSAVVVVFGAACVLGLVLPLAFRRELRNLSARHVDRIPAVLRRLARRIEPEAIADTLLRLRERLAVLLSVSTLVVVAQMVSAVLLARALSIDLSPAFIAMGASLIGLMMMLPITINGLGAREGILVLLFSAAGAPREEAIALGLLMFATSILSRLPGFFAWARRPKLLTPYTHDP